MTIVRLDVLGIIYTVLVQLIDSVSGFGYLSYDDGRLRSQ